MESGLGRTLVTHTFRSLWLSFPCRIFPKLNFCKRRDPRGPEFGWRNLVDLVPPLSLSELREPLSFRHYMEQRG